jgi:hypothetical protein
MKTRPQTDDRILPHWLRVVHHSKLGRPTSHIRWVIERPANISPTRLVHLSNQPSWLAADATRSISRDSRAGSPSRHTASHAITRGQPWPWPVRCRSAQLLGTLDRHPPLHCPEPRTRAYAAQVRRRQPRHQGRLAVAVEDRAVADQVAPSCRLLQFAKNSPNRLVP